MRGNFRMHALAKCTLSFFVTIVLTGAANAQVGRDVLERGSNRAQISQGKKSLERDTAEVEQFAGQLASLRTAVGKNDVPAANQALAQLVPALGREVQQGGELAEAYKRELMGSVSETGSNRRESRRNRDDSNAFGRSDDDRLDQGRDAINRVDDARDVADDKQDLEALGKRVARQQQIAGSLQGYQINMASATGRSDAEAKISLLSEFEQLMRQGVAAVEGEITEDRREAAEDRRETRDDVREADELDNKVRQETGNAGRRRRR